MEQQRLWVPAVSAFAIAGSADVRGYWATNVNWRREGKALEPWERNRYVLLTAEELFDVLVVELERLLEP